MSIRGFFLAAIPIAALILASGCGGSDSSATGAQSGGEVTVTTGSLSKAAFIKQADAICKTADTNYNLTLAKFAETVKRGGSAQKEAAQLHQLVHGMFIPAYRTMNEEIGALGAPSGDEAAVTAFVGSIEQVLDAAEEDSKSFEVLNPFDRSIQLARAYGLTGCAHNLA